MSARPSSRVRRDRHGRGLRSPVFRASVPAARTRAQRFARVAAEVMERVRDRAPDELETVVLALDMVPPPGALGEGSAFADMVDPGTTGVELGRAYPAAPGTPPTIVVHRMPVLARAAGPVDLQVLLGEVIAEQAGLLIGRDPEQLLPHGP
ncbi:metallopeptidase family protein [Brevibacterium litoralis]|uniref:metallopeptidase family protein n=1 Tax=Brevibacterium litoralis TaxID=3138935 RepID=UPI0032EF1F46